VPTNAAPGRGFEQALQHLADAVAERRVEPISTAYLALRREARSMSPAELLEHVDRFAGKKARTLIVSAFSHRRCFMCRNGTTPCQVCEGSGTTDGEPCTQCDGLGIEVCPFCLGTGWIDPNEIPPEIRQPVRQRQIVQVEKDLARLAKVGPKIWTWAAALSPEKRVEFAAWLIRLQARLSDLAETLAAGKDERAGRFKALAEKLDRMLARLRRSPRQLE